MTTYKRICLRDHTIADRKGNSMSVYRGKEYLTSNEKNNLVTVFGPFWAKFPIDIFGGEIKCT